MTLHPLRPAAHGFQLRGQGVGSLHAEVAEGSLQAMCHPRRAFGISRADGIPEFHQLFGRVQQERLDHIYEQGFIPIHVAQSGEKVDRWLHGRCLRLWRIMEQRLDSGREVFSCYGLADVAIHTGSQTTSAVPFHGVSRQRDDWDVRAVCGGNEDAFEVRHRGTVPGPTDPVRRWFHVSSEDAADLHRGRA